MNEHEPTTGHQDCGADAAAYVLGALDSAEAEEFGRHMEQCVVCRDEVVAFGEVVDSLPMAVDQERVPGGLKRRVMKQVRADARRREGGQRSVRSGRPALLPAGMGGRVAAIGAAASLLIATVVGVELGTKHDGNRRLIRASVIRSPGSARIQLNGEHAELIVRRLPPPPTGRIYEVWLKRPNRPPAPTSALFSVTAAGSGNVDVPGNLHDVTTVMVTEEPAGGSVAPTHPALIVANLT